MPGLTRRISAWESKPSAAMATAITIGTRTFVLADSVDEVELMLELSSARPSEWVGIDDQQRDSEGWRDDGE